MLNKNIRILLFSIALIFITVGCGGGSQSPADTQEASNSESQAVTNAKTATPNDLPQPTSNPITTSSTTDTTTAESIGTVSQEETGAKQTESNVLSGDNKTADDEACLTDADSKTGFCVEGESVVPNPSSGIDKEKCENASGDLLQQCMDEAEQMIKQNPALCDTATGMMAYMCSMTQSSQVMTEPNDEHQNPCASLPAGDKEKCEESFKSNPYAKPTEDPNNTGKADPNDRLATDEIDYSNVYVESFDPNNLPKVAKSNFTELGKFSRMSKIRSGVGHDFSYNTPEYDSTRSNCKSMKHYFIPTGVPKENAAYAHTPHTFQWMSIKFYSPVEGRIVGVYTSENEYGPEANFTVASSEYPGYFFMFFHIAMDPALKEGSVVQAGQQIGTLGSEEAWGEIAVSAKIGPKDHRLISFLDVATDEVLQEYTARGVGSSSDVIVTKEQRDANPLACDNSEAGWFIGTSNAGTENTGFVTWVFESKDNWFFFDE
jgi:hypothetical protein